MKQHAWIDQLQWIKRHPTEFACSVRDICHRAVLLHALQ